jgi:Cytochrome P460
MKTFLKISLLGSLVALTTNAIAQDVPYPNGYRDWHHVKSMVIIPGHALHDAFGGIHHLYANKKAQAGYAKGKFADGSVIVFDLLEANDGGNALVEGKRKVVGVMHKDSKRYAATGGWGFEGFKGNSKTDRAVGRNAASACFNCHEPQSKHDYVFSDLRP